jgi:hypothetical protein
LRARRGRVLDREERPLALVAGEHLGEPVAEERRRLDERNGDPVRLLAKAVPLQPKRDQRVVVRPDGAVVVPDRVVPTLAGGHRAHTPAREQHVRQQTLRDGGGALVGDDPAPEQMADVRGHRIDLPLIGVERKHVVPPRRAPEGPVEPLLQLCGRFL